MKPEEPTSIGDKIPPTPEEELEGRWEGGGRSQRVTYSLTKLPSDRCNRSL